MVGKTISHYRVLEKLGEGGMGVVYRAEDTSLGRPVALKFLAAHLLNDNEAKQRFLREAKAAAAITHPNICTVHEVGDEGGKTFLAMAYLEGESLEDKITRGPLPLKDVLDIGRQIAEGLEAAHEKGIVHRDIKPANIMVDGKGRATILDFGLARLTEASKLTGVDQTVGTVAYMSPEQIQGGDVDHRTDIWALGCVLYAMVAGVRPFQGQYDQALAYEIVQEEPEPLTGVRTGVPIELEMFVGKCLAKDREDRYSYAHELATDLRTLHDKLKTERSTIAREADAVGRSTRGHGRPNTKRDGGSLPAGIIPVRKRKLQVLQALVVALGLSLVGTLLSQLLNSDADSPPAPVRRFSFQVDGIPQRTGATISPDGKHILYAAETDGTRVLWMRSLANETPRQLGGTEGAVSGFWSPDSLSIGFGVVGTEMALKRLSIDESSPMTLCSLPVSGATAFRGGTWSPDGEQIVFASGQKLYMVSARGGEPRLVMDVPDDAFNVPHFLTANILTYTRTDRTVDQVVELFDMTTHERREVVPGDEPAYSTAGYLLISPQNDADVGIRALPFSLDTLSPTGEAFPVTEYGRLPSVSEGGTLVYTEARTRSQISVRNRHGEVERTLPRPIPGIARSPVVSPDGHFLAYVGIAPIWVYDLERNSEIPLDVGFAPAWGPSDRELTFRVDDEIWAQPIGGHMNPRVLVKGSGTGSTLDWSPGGDYAAWADIDLAQKGAGIRYAEIQEDRTLLPTAPLLRESFGETEPAVSPDGKYLAYRSEESGRSEIYIRRFPTGEGKWRVSSKGGVHARWSADGSELFYIEGLTLMVVSVSLGDKPMIGQPAALFESHDLAAPIGGRPYDVFPDGNRFVTVTVLEDDEVPASYVRVVENWREAFGDREQD